MPQFVFGFSEGRKELKELLGGKGANLAEMTNLGLPVPPGFTITDRGLPVLPAVGRGAGRAAGAGDHGRCAGWRTTWAAGWGIGTTRCWSVSVRERCTRCPG